MGLILRYYKWRHPGVPEDKIPARYKISLWKGFVKPIRKWFSAVVIPTIPFNNLRVSCYRLVGYKIGGYFYRYALLSGRSLLRQN